MRKRLLIGLLSAGLLAAMLPGVVSAGDNAGTIGGSAWVRGDIEFHYTVGASGGPDSASGNFRFASDAGALWMVKVDCVYVEGTWAAAGGEIRRGPHEGQRGYLVVQDNRADGTPDRAHAVRGSDTCQAALEYMRDGFGWTYEITKGNVTVRER